ncbi:hypothetical protein RRF57_005947 [Xylaria bambusicola]|uniref:Argonaute linker 2 domain-containing protein n=1 Tax=Xylaria bambusicola TaxID=326684 RepID=A0AAN7Z6F1_9PEZI
MERVNGPYMAYPLLRDKYGITIQNSALPVVNIGGKDNPSYLPAEVCDVRPGQPARPRLSRLQGQKMIRFAVRPPAQNARSIVTSGRKLLGFEPTNAILNAFNTNIPQNFITVLGRVLGALPIKYSGAGVAIPRSGSWDLRSVKFATKADLPSWTYLRISL